VGLIEPDHRDAYSVLPAIWWRNFRPPIGGARTGLPEGPRILPAVLVLGLPATRLASLPAVRGICGPGPTRSPCRDAELLAKRIAGNSATLVSARDGAGLVCGRFIVFRPPCWLPYCQQRGLPACRQCAEFAGRDQCEVRVALPYCRQHEMPAIWQSWRRLEIGGRWACLPADPRIPLGMQRWPVAGKARISWSWINEMPELHCHFAGNASCSQFCRVSVGQ
jgi:hypothetical protein